VSDEPVLDLHGLRVADAVRRTTAFVVAEQRRGTAVVRIVTGHGTGALKQAVGDVLRSHPSVAYLRPTLTSSAAVLVVLKPPARGQH
jgi:DNA-nicking Smr family endonuclease